MFISGDTGAVKALCGPPPAVPCLLGERKDEEFRCARGKDKGLLVLPHELRAFSVKEVPGCIILP